METEEMRLIWRPFVREAKRLAELARERRKRAEEAHESEQMKDDGSPKLRAA